MIPTKSILELFLLEYFAFRIIYQGRAREHSKYGHEPIVLRNTKPAVFEVQASSLA